MQTRHLSDTAIANDLATRITGKMIGLEDIYDPKTGQWLTEAEIVKKGAVFCTVQYNKVLGKNDTTRKSRLTALPTPFIRKTWTAQMIVNIDWQGYINRRSSHGQFEAADHRSNGIENLHGCRAIGVTKSGKPAICGVVFRMLEDTKYFDEDGNEYQDVEGLKAEFLKVTSEASKQKEADKHGIEVEKDPQYRTVRIDSCGYVNCFGFNFIPTVTQTVKINIVEHAQTAK